MTKAQEIVKLNKRTESLMLQLSEKQATINAIRPKLRKANLKIEKMEEGLVTKQKTIKSLRSKVDNLAKTRKPRKKTDYVLVEKYNKLLQRLNDKIHELEYYKSGAYDKELKEEMKRALTVSTAVARFVPKASEVRNLIDTVKVCQ